MYINEPSPVHIHNTYLPVIGGCGCVHGDRDTNYNSRSSSRRERQVDSQAGAAGNSEDHRGRRRAEMKMEECQTLIRLCAKSRK